MFRLSTKLLLMSLLVMISIPHRTFAQAPECSLEKYAEFLTGQGRDLFISSSLCETAVKYLTQRLTGAHGPVLQEDIEIIMCSDECLQNDLLHQIAMSTTGCNCAQLSSDSHIPNDFCLQNSARLLCDQIGICGTWECRADDYMCPRHEWDTLYRCGQEHLVPSIMLSLGMIVLATFYGV